MPVVLRVARLAIEEREVKKYPWVAFCDEHTCHFIVSAKDEDQGLESLGQHKCPYGAADPHRIPGKPLLSAMWRELDACMDGIMLPDTGDVKTQHYKSRATGIATCLYICLGGEPGYYPGQADITREAVRRYKMRIGELAWEPTQGDNYDALRDGPTPRWYSVVTEIRSKGIEAQAELNSPPNRAKMIPRQQRVATTRTRSAAPKALTIPPPAPLTIPPSVPTVSTEGDMEALIAAIPPDNKAGVLNGIKAGLDYGVLANIYNVPISVIRALAS